MRNKITVIIAGLFIMCCCFCISGCGTDDIDISGYEDAEIHLTGIEDKDIVVTIADLKAMDCKTVKTESTSDKIGEVKATGPELDTVLGEYGYSKKDFKSMTVYGTDEYSVPMLNKYFTEHDIYLAYGIDGEPLDKESAPCRIIIPKSDSAYWTRMVYRIDFEK